MVMHYMVFYADNYADEFDVRGFALMTKDQYEEFDSALKNISYPYEYYFGTNESIYYHDEEHLRHAFSIAIIYDPIEEKVRELFSGESIWSPAATLTYGMFPPIENEVPDE